MINEFRPFLINSGIVPSNRSAFSCTVSSVTISIALMFNATLASATDINWSMPDRLLENIDYPGYDANFPVPVYDPSVQMLPADGWLVNLDACSNNDSINNSTAKVSYEWFVNEESIGVANDCRFSYKFPEEGVYQVSVNLISDLGVIETVTQEITVQDWLIVALGDGYGSGEGNPIEPVSVEALKEYSALAETVAELNAEIQSTNDEIVTLETEQANLQQNIDDALVVSEEAESALTDLQQQQQSLSELKNNVENDPAVLTEKENVRTAQLFVDGWQAEVDENQQKYNSCSNFITCAIALNTLNQSQQELQNAQNDLAAAEAVLLAAKDDAVVKHSQDATLTTFNQLAERRDSLNDLVEKATTAYEEALAAYQLAIDTLQSSIDTVTDLQNDIAETQQLSDEASSEAKRVYLDSLPVWTRTAPSWGTPEPDYAQIVLNGQIPGEALRCHRSMTSGQARAALRLEQADPQTSVTFLHLSCSGATVDNLIDSFEGQDIENLLATLKEQPSNIDFQGLPTLAPIKAQIEAAANISAGREVDAIIISVGAGDVKFSEIVNECISGEACDIGEASILAEGQAEKVQQALSSTLENTCSPTSLFNETTELSVETTTFPFTNNCLSDYQTAEINADGSVDAGKALEIFNDSYFGTLDNEGVVTQMTLAEKLTSIQSEDGVTIENTTAQGNDSQNGTGNSDTDTLDPNSKATLDKHFPALDSHRIYITEYPDPTNDDSSSYCGWVAEPFVSVEQDIDAGITTSNEVNVNALINIPGITLSETKWLDSTVLSSLRDELQNTSASLGWTYVADTDTAGETISTASKPHGYCAENNWVVKLSESLLSQQEDAGFMHPNREGHDLYQQAIAAQLIQDFYPNGLAMPPRVPDRKQLGIPNPVDVQVASGSSDLGSLAPVQLLMLSLTTLLIRLFYTRRVK